ncbi:MAG TPA: HPF/RaiA family ribosome-associated protein [Steroidobacteraceae bacterium]|nr:HPF/RaiA family ribosome-associated protein [Steroidobacteraceae bacterium]
MQIPLEIEFRNMDRSEAMETKIRELAAHLERFGAPIIRCHVAIEAPHRHHRQGRLFETNVRLTVPGREIVIRQPRPQDHSHEDAYVALRDAFRAAQRQLEDFVRIRRGDVKTHAGMPHGQVSEIDRERHSGRIETADGRLIYFHGNAVLGRSFGELTVGTTVHFVEEAGDLGPQASTVYA